MFGGVLVMRLWAAEWASAAVDVGLVVCCYLGPHLLRWTGRYDLIVTIVLGAVFALLCWLGWMNPNPGLNAATMALAEIPLFAIILFGPRVGYVWSAACAFAVLCIGLSDFQIPFTPTPEERAAFNEYWAVVIMSITLVSVGVFYSRGKDESLRRIRELETDRRESELTAVRAEAETKLQQAERFASLGRLAAAVAHEINNPLSYVKGNLTYAAQFGAARSSVEVREALSEALGGVERIRLIVDDLRGLIRSSNAATPEADVARAAQSAAAIAESHTRAKANVHIDVAPRCYAQCDEPRLSQAILNLMINSAQALRDGHRDEHLISIRAFRRSAVVHIEVEDNGPGIPASIVQRVREPLFTTKPVGQGTGLGLALVEGTLRSYGGTVEIESRVGRTVVTLTLPALDEIRDRSSPKVHDEDPNVALRILICDDEPLVARAMKRHLGAHDVVLVSGGRQLLDRIAEDHSFDLVFCDLMMPEVSGMDVYDRIMTGSPQWAARFVFMSGGTFTDRAQALRATPGIQFIEKPVSVDDLKAAVRAAMQRVAREQGSTNGTTRA